MRGDNRNFRGLHFIIEYYKPSCHVCIKGLCYIMFQFVVEGCSEMISYLEFSGFAPSISLRLAGILVNNGET